MQEYLLIPIQDWPPQAKLAESYPRLYRDFVEALPVAEYTKRDGFFNLAAHFPLNFMVQPDLGTIYLLIVNNSHNLHPGPKVYMALASRQEDGFSGSTRLHFDLCDAFNIMVHSSPCDGSALWHIFKISDVQKLRAFIRASFDCPSHEDPIHCQQYYLGPTHLAQLERQHGVVPYSYYQVVGEAVFIPAGCPHQVSVLEVMIFGLTFFFQVSNVAHCIKVATDFFPVEAIPVCIDLAGEFREDNLRDGPWKDDVLQLAAQLFFAWHSLLRPLENIRSEFERASNGEENMGSGDECNQVIASKRKGDGKWPDKEDRKRSRKIFECRYCGSGKLFFDHGLTNHL